MIVKIFFLFLTGTLFCLSSAYGQDLGQLKNQKPFTIHGGVSAGMNYYADFSKNDSISKISYGQSPSYFFQADPVFSVYGFNIPVHVLLASQSSSIGTSVFNRFGISPNYKWAKLHLGWRSLNFSQFTLAGQQMLGAGFELTPGKFRIAFMYGKLNDAVTNISAYNNLNNNIPLFKRKGFAGKIGYGSEKNYIEISYLQAKDDSNSVDSIPRFVRPAANQVAGIKGKLTFFKSLSLNIDAGASYYTRDISAAPLEVEGDWDKLAVTNPMASSQIAFGGEARLNYQFSTGSAHLKYRRVDPDYKSMGAFYMQTDMEQYTAGFSMGFLKHKLHVQTDFGWQKNNLAKTAVNNSSRTIGNIGVNFNPNNTWGIDLQYSNYGISQQIIPQIQDPSAILKYDSIRISQVNQSFSISPHLFIQGSKLQHSINFQAGIQSLKNQNELQSGQDFTSLNGNLIYTILFPKTKVNITNTLNYFSTKLPENKTETYTYNIGVSKTFNPAATRQHIVFNSITLSLFGGYFMNKLDGKSTGNTLSINPSLSFQFFKKHSLQINGNYMQSDNKSTLNPGNNQRLMVAARYNFSF